MWSPCPLAVGSEPAACADRAWGHRTGQQHFPSFSAPAVRSVCTSCRALLPAAALWTCTAPLAGVDSSLPETPPLRVSDAVVGNMALVITKQCAVAAP